MNIMTPTALLKKVVKHFNVERKKQLSFVIIFSIFSSVAELISIALLIPFVGFFLDPNYYLFNDIFKNIFTFFSINTKSEILFFVSLSFVLVVVLSGVIKIIFIKTSNRLTENITSDFRIKIFNFLINQDFSYYYKHGSNEIMSNLSQKTTTFSTIIFSSINIFNSLLISIAIISVLVMNDPIYTPALIFIVLIFFFIAFKLKSKKVVESGKSININQNVFIDIFENAVGYLQEIIIYDLKKLFSKSLDEASKKNAKSLANIRSTGMMPKVYLETSFLIIAVLLIYFLNLSSRTLQENIGYLAILAYGVQRILPQINNIYNLSINFRSVTPTVQNFLDILDGGIRKYNFDENNIKEKITFKNEIILKDICYRYNQQSSNVLNNINLSIKKGEKIAIKGRTGSGKTTLINIISGLLNPVSGSILIDGHNLDNEKKKGWQKNLAIVPQTTFLNDGTILENITLGFAQNKINNDKLRQVIEIANLNGFIEKLPNNVNEKVGERGVRLSGGQRQRIGIARALYRDANLIILDEPTNSLDFQTEMSILESLIKNEKDKTMIMISHNDRFLDFFDQIIDLDKLGNK